MVCRTGFEKDPVEKMRHSCAHIMADAVQKLFPSAKVTIGPVIEEGFFYDFDYPRGFAPEDLPKIEAKMKEIIASNLPFESKEVSKKEAIQLFKKMGENYKIEIINGIEGDNVTLYTHGNFTDLCKGPHVSKTGDIKAFKLLKVSGAYWRGDEKNPMLQRIYGTAFASQKDLDDYLKKLEEASRRDHRKLGQELDLFEIEPTIGGGLVLWHPKGAMLRLLVEDFLRKELLAAGYEWVFTPHVGRSTLWETSGHLDFFKENMYAPMDVENQLYYIKPMNCPFHIQIYRSRLRSYRELPVRYAEFGTVYRFERSGVLHGLTRVRGFTQDDAHIFCTPEQVEEEIDKCIKLVLKVLRAFGLTEFKAFIATKPPKAVGRDEDWSKATKALKNTVELHKIAYEMDEGGGAFYGPKIDLKIKDALGRFWQCTTIQFDFNLPERFEISYQGSDGEAHRPFMVHRALVGSFERFLGILIEHYAGAFPAWLAPVQVVLLTLSDQVASFAKKVLEQLRSQGFRAEWDNRNEKLGLKIREAQLKKIPYMLVIGDKEVKASKVAVRARKEGDLGAMSVTDFIEKVKQVVNNFN
ncbi:MAG: threonine--tRNA ligase [Deltaproteobacteria bacterium]|nr:threonine--tRNA ligase [Deltaproteobacteria bacterium]